MFDKKVKVRFILQEDDTCFDTVLTLTKMKLLYVHVKAACMKSVVNYMVYS